MKVVKEDRNHGVNKEPPTLISNKQPGALSWCMKLKSTAQNDFFEYLNYFKRLKIGF